MSPAMAMAPTGPTTAPAIHALLLLLLEGAGVGLGVGDGEVVVVAVGMVNAIDDPYVEEVSAMMVVVAGLTGG
jgi:hypothetical protein